jgi:hypothetical protein
MKNLYLIFFILLLLPGRILGQDIAEIRKNKPVQISGYLGAAAYGYSGVRSTSPFGWVASAGVNLSFWNALQVPVSLQFSDRQLNYNTPVFRRFGLSPSWKWIKLHGGYRNLSFSPYTLAGFTFLGGGLELTPGKFRFACMRGKLDPSWNFPTDNLIQPGQTLELYDRWATAVKIGVGSDRNFFDMFVLKAKDRPNSGDTARLSEIYVHPQENLVLGAAFRFTLFKRLTLEANSAASGVTEDINAIDLPLDSAGLRLVEKFSKILRVNSSTRYAFAGDAAATLRLGRVHIGAKYQRVDPFYKSFGAYYLLTDFENRTLNSQISLWRGKISLSGSYGFQNDNLKGYLNRTSKRRIGSANAQVQPGKGWAIGAQWANFSTDIRNTLIQDGDSLRLATTTSTAGGTVSYTKKTAKAGHSFSGTLFWSSFSDANTAAAINTQNASLNYRIRFKGKKIALRTGLNWSGFNQESLFVQRYGILYGADYDLSGHAGLSLQNNLSLNRTDGQPDGFLSRFNLNFRCTPLKKHQLTAGISWNLRTSTLIRPIDEWQGRLGYNIQF